MTDTIVMKRSSELVRGDVVLNHGMRIEVDREIKHGPGAYGEVYWTTGHVLNHAELAESDPWLHRFVASDGRYRDDADGKPRWTIQGNDRAQWATEVR